METGFIKNTLQINIPIVDNDFCHSIAIGETGCGKTSSFILPNIKDRIKKSHGIFLLDYKNTLHLQVKAIAKELNVLDKVIEIGTTWGNEINYLKNVNENLFITSIDDMLDTKNSSEKFWNISALNLISDIYKTLIVFKNIENHMSIINPMYIKSFNDLKFDYFVDVLNSTIKLFKFVAEIDEVLKLLAIFTKKYQKIYNDDINVKLLVQDIIELKRLKNKLNTFLKDIDKEHPSSGNGGVFSVANNVISTFDTYGINGNDDILDLLNNGYIVILNCDNYNPNFIKCFMNVLYTKLAKRHFFHKSPISLIIDEFQRSIGPMGLPFIDVFREKKVELLAAIQNNEQLELILGQLGTKAFLKNILNQYVFEPTKQFEYSFKKKLYKSEPIFLNDIDLNIAQLHWQKQLYHQINDVDFVYFISNDKTSCYIRNINTNELKLIHILKDNDVYNKLNKNTEIYEILNKSQMYIDDINNESNDNEQDKDDDINITNMYNSLQKITAYVNMLVLFLDKGNKYTMIFNKHNLDYDFKNYLNAISKDGKRINIHEKFQSLKNNDKKDIAIAHIKYNSKTLKTISENDSDTLFILNITDDDVYKSIQGSTFTYIEKIILSIKPNQRLVIFTEDSITKSIKEYVSLDRIEIINI